MFRLLLIFFVLHSSAVVALVENDKQTMPAMHHLFEVKPSADISIPDNFPLNKNKQIDCQTCHGIKDMKDQDFKKIDKRDDDFLREGSYEVLTDFCYRCHEAKPYQRDNIHKMLDSDGEIIERRCLYCHQETLDPEQDIKPDERKLRLPPQNICYGCHLYTPHFNALVHSQEPDEDMKKRINKYEQKHKIILPLSDEGKIMCTTCHSPHQIDVISREKPAGKQVVNSDMDEGIVYSKHVWNKVFVADKKDRLNKLKLQTGKNYVLNYQRIEKEILLRLPAKDGTLCLACHEFEK
jgi:hypothetical protein